MLLDFGTELSNLFIQMHWIVILLICAGIVLCIVESVLPGFGVFGILGLICEVVAIVVHAIISGSALQIFFLILLLVIVTLIIFILFARSARKGWISKSPIVENDTAIPTDYREKTEKELSQLIGKNGIALTDCRPVGKIRVGKNTYEAQSIASTMIQKGDGVKIVAIEDARIIIDRDNKEEKWKIYY